ncbi:Short-chain specific acyl-CoA dehydrogenase, mitochondrial [Portunus trituberculatus]|uniref:Short-chain specific acyl-CoA dehydrogenase, mitochondrial n=1 Tax=Portunus trituberculatus TaxID=210409 RepID=A0A5B7I9M9_PORTR|nr:Short-chain specific acyl-CoA dehydrogenase, mitochondrial [Portunus trituberculatus]
MFFYYHLLFLQVHCDKEYVYPRESLNAMAELGLLGLVVPEEMGGLGASHTFATIIVETLARYGCPSTAMIYDPEPDNTRMYCGLSLVFFSSRAVMHLGACAVLLLRHHNNPKIKDLLSRLNKEKLVGTLAYSDPATGGHFWFPMSSKAKTVDKDNVKLLKYGSWATSAGHADWYAMQTVSPDFSGDYSDLSGFLIFKVTDSLNHCCSL